jgi:hypothetical protein
LSGRNAKKQRKQVVQNQKTTELLRRENGFNRRKFLGYSLSALTIGSVATVIKEQTPFIIGTKKPYALKLFFLVHTGENNSNRVIKEMESAYHSGKPFKILFFENANQIDSDYEKHTLIINNKLLSAEEQYRALLSKGSTKQEALAKIRRFIDAHSVDQDQSEFSNAILAEAAIRGIKALPIESYGLDEWEEYKKESAAYQLIKEKRITLASNNADLGELMRCEIESSEVDRNYMIRRNNNVIQHIEKRFEIALKLFPSLRTERLVGNSLQALGYMGYDHSLMLPGLSAREKESGLIEVSSEKLRDKSCALSESITDSMVDYRPLTTREAYLIALEGRYLSSLLAQAGKVYNAEIADRLIERAQALTEFDLRELDKNSSKIKDPNQRGTFIVNTVLGMNFFDVNVN